MISLSNLEHSYDKNNSIRFPDIVLPQGSQLLILGPSGCGKSTLLHILAGILTPLRGKVVLAGHDFTSLKERKRDEVRGKEIGIIFQRLYLSPSLTCLDALRAAQYFAGLATSDAESERLLSKLGLSFFTNKLPQTLSLGQAQRLAIARALINKPKIVLADEPTSALDDEHALSVANLLKEHSKNCGATLVIATHDARLKAIFENILLLK